MIKAVIFDYGGVVSSGGRGQGLSANLSKSIGISHDEANKILNQPWHKLVRGQISVEEFWQQAEATLGATIPAEGRNVFVSWTEMHPRTEILEFISDLNNDGYVTGLLSNVMPSTAEDIRSHGGYDLFDPCVLSNELGYAKPDIEIYQILLDRLPGINADEILFVDDQEKCMPPASTLGMKTLVATETSDIIEGVRKILVQFNK